MFKLASTAIGGLAALAALIMLRGARAAPCAEQQHEGSELILIYGEPRWDTPPAVPGPPRDRLLILPF